MISIRLVGGVVCCSVVLCAASVPIGVLNTIDSIRLDNSQVRGNGTVLDGSVIETAKNPSQLNLKNGTRFDLYPNSRVTVYNDRVVLDRGASQIHASAPYPVVVNTLSVLPLGPSSTIRVSRDNSKTLVAAVAGQAEVRNAKGVLIARVTPGFALDFDQQPGGAAGASQVSGKVSNQNGHYFLTDETTKTTVELQGDNLGSNVGFCISATGSVDPSATPAPGATQLIHVASYKRVPCVAGGAGTPAGATTVGGISHAAMAGIVVAVVAGGTLGGLAAAGRFSGNGRQASAF